MRREVELVGRFERHTLPDGGVVVYDPEPHAYYGAVNKSAKAKGGYSAARDSRYPGASTPAKCLDTNPDPLMGWSAKLEAQGACEYLSALPVDEVEAILAEGGDQLHRALRDAELDWRSVRDRAATRGTNVHERIFLALAQDERPPSLASLADEERGYGQAAIKWWRARKPKPLYAEQVTLCELHGFAGRFDLLCEIDGERVLVDAKTRDRGAVRKSDHVQLEGYELANRSCGIGESHRRLALVLTPWGEPREFESLADERDFLAALEAYRRGRELDKRMRAQEAELKEAA